MQRKLQTPRTPVITVQRKSSRLGDRFWFYCGSRPVTMVPAIALAEAARGTVRIRTVGDR